MNTYNPKKVIIALGNHIVTGYAEDSFVSIEQASDGITHKVGCDGEVVRSINPDNSFNLKVSVQQSSKTNKFLIDKHNADKANGNGLFPVTVKDLMGGTLFTSNAAWVTKFSSQEYGKESGGREWNIVCGYGELSQS